MAVVDYEEENTQVEDCIPASDNETDGFPDE